uniref:Citrate synthase n=1 Tax=Eutreptiella gymnastica TaxID=73025 RepID=A0A6U7YHS9_9EUGL|mmetsp:Transcript_144915/g.252728  ORF Transcript_144915/g.252728 Transcript_144915/m.252728 type:complete len:457 (+) Transcript_144915:95-1465(+)
MHRVFLSRSSFSGARTFTSLKETLRAQLPAKRKGLKDLLQNYGDVPLGEVTVAQCVQGARSVKCMLWETSLLDAEEGIRFRGHTIPDLQKALPSFSGPAGAGEPTPEGLIWLLLSGNIPTKEEEASLTAEFHKRGELPAEVEALMRSLPTTMHPMTQFNIGVMALQPYSKFAESYRAGIAKSDHWDPAFEDILDVIAKIPKIAAIIYRRAYHDGVVVEDKSSDYSGNFCRMLGYNNPGFDELMRLYMVIHSDHEGGNASAHSVRLTGSTLSDPYQAFASGLNALAGPLHGLANQEVLRWIQALDAKFKAEGKQVNQDTIKEFAWETLNAGKVVPGYGHAVLRKTDPRYTAQREFGLKHMPDDHLFKLVDTIYHTMPGVLLEHGKVRNPWPNVDSHSGVLLWHYNFKEYDFYTVLFGVSRAMGALSQLFWDRALGLALERPKSVTPEWIENYCKNKK